MQQEIHSLESEHSNPIAFIMVPTFVGALLWVVVMLSRIQ